MLENIHFEETDESPEIILDKSQNIILVKGRSMPENAIEFYEPMHNWIKEYVKAPNPTTKIEFRLLYLNSSSSRKFIQMLIEFEKLHKEGKEVVVNWYVQEDDELMEDKGGEFKQSLRLNFNIIKK